MTIRHKSILLCNIYQLQHHSLEAGCQDFGDNLVSNVAQANGGGIM